MASKAELEDTIKQQQREIKRLKVSEDALNFLIKMLLWHGVEPVQNFVQQYQRASAEEPQKKERKQV